MSLENARDGVRPDAAAHLISAVPGIVRSTVLMAVERRGVAQGRAPAWLDAASDVRFMEASGHESMNFVFLAPKLGEAAAALYRQQEFWPSKPDPEATGLDIACAALRDVAAENRDSTLYDDAVLKRLRGLRRVFSPRHPRLTIGAQDPASSAGVDPATIEAAERLTSSTPKPQAARIVGRLDMLRVSTQSFALKLDDGSEIPGVYLGGAMADLAALLNERVVVSGRVIYRASGRPLRLDADRLAVGVGEPTLWSRIPVPVGRPIVERALRQRQGPRSGVAAVIGQWPGDETDDEVAKYFDVVS